MSWNAAGELISETLSRKFAESGSVTSCDLQPYFEVGYNEPDCGGDPFVTCTETTKSVSQSFSVPTICQGGLGECGTSSLSFAFNATLSDMDTEADAAARLLNGIPPFQPPAVWSDWGTSACVAQWQERTAFTGPNFQYTQAEWRVVRTGLTPVHSYRVDVPIYRRAYGTGDYVLYQTVSTVVVTNGSGAFTVSAYVPNDEGYQSYAGAATVTKL